MAAKTYTFTGRAMWCKLFDSNKEMFEWNEDTSKYDKPSTVGGVFMLDVVLDNAEFKRLVDSKSLSAKNFKLNDAGEYVVRFKRKNEARGKNGELLEWASGGPIIQDAAGETWTEETNGHINNGAEVKVTVTVYETRYSPGTRLDKVVVHSNPERTETTS